MTVAFGIAADVPHRVGGHRRLLIRLLAAMGLWLATSVPVHAAGSEQRVPVLVYHRFGATVADSMTVRTATFELHLALLAERGHRVIPLAWLLDYCAGERPTLPPRAIVITVDDGHATVYSDLLPVVRRERIPVSLFIYPSAISNASYAMTWPQLTELVGTGLFDVQSHTYWHPNFGRERKQLSEAEYLAFVRKQLQRSRTVLERRIGAPVTALAWPFGVHNEVTDAEALAAGYRVAFTLEQRPVACTDAPMVWPRYLIVEPKNPRWFENLLRGIETASSR